MPSIWVKLRVKMEKAIGIHFYSTSEVIEIPLWFIDSKLSMSDILFYVNVKVCYLYISLRDQTHITSHLNSHSIPKLRFQIWNVRIRSINSSIHNRNHVTTGCNRSPAGPVKYNLWFSSGFRSHPLPSRLFLKHWNAIPEHLYLIYAVLGKWFRYLASVESSYAS